MLDHFFVSSSDGALHDTRQADWSSHPLRRGYQRHYPEINNTREFKATLRAGQFAWPGGYPLYLLCSDGVALCFDCARKEARNIMDSIERKASDGWRVVACDVNWEDTELYCEHCNKKIESAYGED